MVNRRTVAVAGALAGAAVIAGQKADEVEAGGSADTQVDVLSGLWEFAETSINSALRSIEGSGRKVVGPVQMSAIQDSSGFKYVALITHSAS